MPEARPKTVHLFEDVQDDDQPPRSLRFRQRLRTPKYTYPLDELSEPTEVDSCPPTLDFLPDE